MDSDDDHEETSSVAAYRGVPATVILINVFDQETAEISHAATCRVIRQYLRQSRSQLIAVCLFGIEVDDDSSMLGDKNILDVFPLTMPTLDDYKKLQNTKIATMKQDTELRMSSVLLHCSKLFANCKKQLSVRTVLMLSRLDTPPTQTDQTPALMRVEDLAESNVDIKLINVSNTNQKADDFYQNFHKNANIGREGLPKPVFDVQEIEKLMYLQSHRHLAVSQLSFEIGDGMSIGVGVFSLLRESRQDQKPAYLGSETNDIVTPVTETNKITIPTVDNLPMDVDDEELPKQVPLLKSELINYQEYGGERVEFKDAEMKYLKNPFGPPMLKLLGFKPALLLSKEKWFLKKGYFLFPNEGIIEGSTVAFKALHQACIETGMVAICILCTRVNSRPINVALSPCTHPLGLDVDTGFDVINIPFAESVRALPEVDNDDSNITSEANKTVMKDIINTIKFEYKPDIFEDPKIQSQYKNIEAIALHDDDIEPFVDTTKPSSDKFSSLDDDLFHKNFGPFQSDAVKRPNASKEGGNLKKVKMEEVDESLLKSRLANQKVNQYTVADLKDILKCKDIPQLPALTGLKKAQLVDLVYKYFCE